MCGSSEARTRRVLVDNTILQCCPSCERFGKVLEPNPKAILRIPGNVPQALEKRKRQQTPQDVFESREMRMELVEDFAQRIRIAREKKGWTRQDLGGRIGEREVVVARFENGTLHPPDAVARRMERELDIKLYEGVQAAKTPPAFKGPRTLGDLLREAQKKKEP